MVIQCPECRTRFKLADEKLKPEGIKVRCARCQRVFAVRQEETEAAPEIAAESVSEPTAPSAVGSGAAFGAAIIGEPLVQQPPQDDAWVDDPFADGENPREEFPEFASPAADGAADGPEFDFSGDENRPLAGESDIETSPPDETKDAEPFPAFDSEFDFATGRPGKDSFEDESRMTEETEGEDFKTDSFAFDSAAPEVEEEKSTGRSSGFSFDEEDRADDFSFPGVQSSLDDTWDPSAAGNPFETSETGSGTDEFDFVQSASLPEAAAAPPSAAEPPPPILVQAPAISLAEKKTAEESPPPKQEAHPVTKRRRRRPVSALFLSVVLLLLALTGAAAYFLSQGGPEEMARLLDRFSDPPPAPTPSQIRLVELRGSFVQNSQEGQIFVISGKAVNDHAEARSAISVKGVLYDEKGNSLLQQTVYAGNPLSEDALKQLTFAKIEEGMNNQFGDSLSNLNVAPGKSIPFTVVFKGLPSNLAEFTVEVADSRPGAKQ